MREMRGAFNLGKFPSASTQHFDPCSVLMNRARYFWLRREGGGGSAPVTINILVSF